MNDEISIAYQLGPYQVIFSFQKMEKSPTNLRVLLSPTVAGRLLGQGGKNIQDIRKSSNTIIHLSKDDSKDRIVVIRGSFENVLKAADLVVDSIESEVTKLGGKNLRILCPDSFCKKLVVYGAQELQNIS